MPSIQIVLTTLPDAGTAGKLARDLVEAGLAACVSVLAPCRSVYRWDNGIQEDEEVPLIIKTTTELYPALETYLSRHHPYKVPEILALNADRGLTAYLDWVAASTIPPATAGRANRP